jgi:hypothetical protein
MTVVPKYKTNYLDDSLLFSFLPFYLFLFLVALTRNCLMALSLACVHLHLSSSGRKIPMSVYRSQIIFHVLFCVCLSSRDLFIFKLKVINFYSFFVLSLMIMHTFYLFSYQMVMLLQLSMQLLLLPLLK